MTCSESKEPKGSERSSSELCRCGHPRHRHVSGCEDCHALNMDILSRHSFIGPEPEEPKPSSSNCRLFEANGWHCLTHVGPNHTDGRCCECGVTRAELEPEEKPECQHPNKQHTGSLYDGPGGRKSWLYYTCPDCGVNLKEEERIGEPEKPCTCGPDEACGDCPAPPEEDPPLTPEEHNLGPEGVDCVFDACPRDPDDCEHGCRAAADELSREANEMEPPEGPEGRPICACGYDPHLEKEHRPGCKLFSAPPPQPERRPPYAVAYSVQGHLFEVALPGDATVKAVDGALVIQHHLGPVAGITEVLPIINKES